MIGKIALGVAAILALIVLYAAFLAPTHFKIERTIEINAPAATVFPHINDVHKFQEWNPWRKLDPESKVDFAGPPEGIGATFSWDGKKSGTGSMKVVESQPISLVKFELKFEKPYQSVAYATFSLKPEAAKTTVTWTMEGENAFVPRLFCLFFNMDKMVGKDFEDGLAGLRRLSEAEAPPAN